MTDLCNLLSLSSDKYVEYLAGLNFCEPRLVEEARKAGIVHAHLYLGIVPDGMSVKSFKFLVSKVPSMSEVGSHHLLLPLTRKGSVLPRLDEREQKLVNSALSKQLGWIIEKINEAEEEDDEESWCHFKEFLHLSDEELSTGGRSVRALRARYGLVYSNEPTGLPAISELMGLSAEVFYQHFGTAAVPPEMSETFKKLTFRELLLGMVPMGVAREQFIECQSVFEDLTVTRLALLLEGWKVNKHLLCPFIRHKVTAPHSHISTGDEVLHFLVFFGLKKRTMGETDRFESIRVNITGSSFRSGNLEPHLNFEELQAIKKTVKDTVQALTFECGSSMGLFRDYYDVDKYEDLYAFLLDRYVDTFPNAVMSAKSVMVEQKAFGSEYVPIKYLCDDFMAVFREIVDGVPSVPPGVENYLKDTKINYFSPYSAIINSSGMGKSRFMLSKKSDDTLSTLMILFVCKQGMMPKKTEVYDSLLREIAGFPLKEQTDLLAFTFVKIMKAVRDRVFDSNGKLRPYFNGWGAVPVDNIILPAEVHPVSREEYKAIAASCKGLTDETGKETKLCFGFDEASELLDVFFAAHPAFTARDREKEPEVLNLSQVPKEKLNEGASKIESISLFRLIKRAFAFMYDEFKCPCFFTSTTTRLTGFFPNIKVDPSRYVDSRDDMTFSDQRYLHRVLGNHGAMNTYIQFLENWDDIESGEGGWFSYLSGRNRLRDLCYYGRPFWGSLISNPEFTFKDVLNGIRAKLPYTTVNPEDRSMERWSNKQEQQMHKDRQLNVVWMLARTVYMEPISANTFTLELVDTRMAYLHSFNEVTGDGRVGFPPEPVLSCFAARALHNDPVTILVAFEKLLLNATINLGVMGEFTARFILVMASFGADRIEVDFDKMVEKEEHKYIDFFAPRTAHSFMNHLCLGSSKVEEILKRRNTSEFKRHHDAYMQHLEGAVVAFCNWWGVADRKYKRTKEGKDDKDGASSDARKTKKASVDTVDQDTEHVLYKNNEYLEDVVRSALQKCCAVALRDNFPYVDLIIPICYDTQASKYGAMFVQVKNWASMDSRQLRIVFDAMNECWPNSSLPIVNVILSLGSERFERAQVIADNSKAHELVTDEKCVNIRFDAKKGNRPGIAILDYHSFLPLLLTEPEASLERKELFKCIKRLGKLDRGVEDLRASPEAYSCFKVEYEAHPNPYRRETGKRPVRAQDIPYGFIAGEVISYPNARGEHY